MILSCIYFHFLCELRPAVSVKVTNRLRKYVGWQSWGCRFEICDSSMTLMKLHLVNKVNKKKQTFSEPTDTQGFIIDENCMF